MSASGVPAGLEALRSQACVVELPGIPKEEGRRLLESWLQREGRRLQPAQMSAALERIPELAPASLYWLVWQEVRLWRSGRGHCHTPPTRLWRSDHDDQTLPPKEAGILQILFRRLVDEHGRTLVKRSLGVLAAAGEGLAEDELLGVLSADEAVMKELHSRARHKIPPGRIPVAVWARLRSDLGAHIATRVMDQLVLLCFRDGRVRDAVAGEFALEQGLAGMHQRLADYFEAQPLFYDSAPNLRKLRVLVRHQALTGRLERVGGTLTDLRFLEAKCCTLDVRRALMRRPSYRGIYALLADFRMALDMGERLGASETLRTRLAGLRSCLASQSANIAEWPQGLSWQVAWDARRRRMGLDGIAWLRPDRGERPALDPYLISDGSRLARRLAPSLFSTTYVAVLAESGLAATVGNEGRLVVIDTETGEEVFSVVVEPASTCGFVRAEQPFVVVGGISGALHLVDADRGEVSASLRPFRSEVIGLAASRQGRFVAGCGSKDRTVKVIELATEQEWKLDEDYYHSFNDCAFSPAEDLLAVASTTGAVYLHRAPGGDWVEVYKHKADADVCVFSPSGGYLASGGHRGDLILWDVEKAREVWRKEITAASIPALAFVGETRLFSGDADGFIEEHDVQTGSHVRRWTELPGTLFRMVFDTKRTRLLAAASGLWEIDLLQAPAEKAVELGAVYCVAALPDGTVAVGGAHPALSVLNPDETPDPAPKVLEAEGLVSLVEVGPLPNQIVVGWSVADKVSSPAGRIEVRELGSGAVKVLAEGNADVACGCYLNACCFPNPQLDLLVACFSLQRRGGGGDRLVGWKLPARSQVQLPCHSGQGPSAVGWISDRNLAVAGHGDGTVRVYQFAGGDELREIKRYRLHEDVIWGCVYAPAFGGLITAGRDGYLKISDPDAGKEIRALQRGGSPITWCALAPNGVLLATASSSGAIRLWGPDRNEPLALFRAGSYLNSVKFSCNGEWLYFGGGRGLVGRLRLRMPAH